MSLPIEAEELLDVLRQGILDRELADITRLIEFGISGQDLAWMQFLQREILAVYHMKGIEGYEERQKMCDEIATGKYGHQNLKVN